MTVLPRLRTVSIRLPVYIILFFSIISCANFRTEVASKPGNPASLTSWFFEGKIALKADNKSQSAFIKWDQAASNFRIELYGPFGKGHTTIEKNGSISRLFDNKQELKAATPDELFYKATGVHMPVSWVKWWLRGLPSPAGEVSGTQQNETGRLVSFDQAGWHLSYSRFTTTGGYTLPTKLTMSNKDYNLKLVINSWQIGLSRHWD